MCTLIRYNCCKTSLRAHCVPGTALGIRESAAKKTNHIGGAYCLENGKRKQAIHKFLSVLLSIMKNEQHKNGIEGRHLTCAGQRVSPRCGSIVIHPLTPTPEKCGEYFVCNRWYTQMKHPKHDKVYPLISLFSLSAFSD